MVAAIHPCLCLRSRRIVVEIACLSHREIDKRSVNPGQCAYRTVGCCISPCKVRLSDFEDIREKGTEKSSFPRITVREGLIPRDEASFFWLANFVCP